MVLGAALNRIAQYRQPKPGTQPEYLHPSYRSSVDRAPQKPPVQIPQTLSEVTGPMFRRHDTVAGACDLSVAPGGGEAQGQRIVVNGRVLDEDGRPVTNTMIEVWQANAAGRYLHRIDQHHAPLDPNFIGQGVVFTDDAGWYKFTSIRPGCYPWNNHFNAWRPAHIHFSLFGPAVATRLVTQMYFPGDPMLDFDPIFQCSADKTARNRLISRLDWESTIPHEAIGFQFDLILRGREATPFEDNHKH